MVSSVGSIEVKLLIGSEGKCGSDEGDGHAVTGTGVVHEHIGSVTEVVHGQ